MAGVIPIDDTNIPGAYNFVYKRLLECYSDVPPLVDLLSLVRRSQWPNLRLTVFTTG